MENVFSTLTSYGEGWNVTATRKFNEAELKAVSSVEVVESQYGKSACFHMIGGGSKYIPISKKSEPSVAVGNSLSMSNLTLLTLSRPGSSDIIRVEL